MRIVILSPTDPSRIGGMERVIREFSFRLKNYYDVEILCTGDVSSEYTLNGVNVHIIKRHGAPYFYAPDFRKAVLKLKPDIVYAHNFGTYMPFVASKIKNENLKIKLVIHPHYHPTGSSVFNTTLRAFYDRTVGKGIFASADALIANSKSELAQLCHKFPIKAPCFVVYNGIDLASIERATRQNTEGGVIPILYVGRLVAYKNPILAVQVMHNLPEQYRLYIVGKGPLEDRIRKMIETMDLKDRVKMLGFISDNEVYGWYKASHCLVHLSLSESFGMTCIEALAAGTPSLANEDGFGLSETIRLFPDSIFRCTVKTETVSDISNRIEFATSKKPAKADLSQFEWGNLTLKLREIFDGLTQ